MQRTGKIFLGRAFGKLSGEEGLSEEVRLEQRDIPIWGHLGLRKVFSGGRSNRCTSPQKPACTWVQGAASVTCPQESEQSNRAGMMDTLARACRASA